MIFSKKTLFAAAVLAGSALVASAANVNVSGTVDFSDSNISNDLVIEGDTNITLDGNTVTLDGAFLSKDGSLADQKLTNWIGDTITDAEGGSVTFDNTSTITISGGGSFFYTGGTLGDGYYTDSYQMDRGDNNFNPGGNVWNAWAGMDSFWSAGIFTGKLVVESDVKFNVIGQLSQYVYFAQPTLPNENTDYKYGFDGFAGIQSVELENGATLSFAGSKKNMVNARPNLSSLDPQENYNPTAKLSLNFVNNLKAEANSTIILGTDEASANRIVFNADEGFEATVGRLHGNGRLYTTGNGSISFIGVSELNSGSNVNADGSVDTTGNTWKSGNLLADIVLGTKKVYVGSTGPGAAVVDNVFANATAIHLNGNDGANTGYVGQNIGSIAVAAGGGSKVNGAAGYVSGFTTPTVYVYGNQVFNNFQSLWVDRTALLANPEIASPGTQVYEPVNFTVSGRSTALGTEVYLKNGAVLTINQDRGRDGIFDGNIISSAVWDGSGLVVKTGKGRFTYWGDDTIADLRIEEGEWIFSGAFSSNVVLAKEGRLVVNVGEPETADFVLRAIDEDSVLHLNTFYSLENDITGDSLSELKDGVVKEDQIRYREVRYGDLDGVDNARGIQITKQQSLFYGKVLVRDGITLTLGGEDSSESVFSSAGVIELVGAGDEEASQWKASVLAITGTQLIRNLKGDAGLSAVTIADDSSLVLTNTNPDQIVYSGGFAGHGNLVKLGNYNQRIYGNANGELTGAVSVLAGAVSLTQGSSSAGVSGMLLKAGTSSSFGGNARVGALIGEEGASVAVAGDLTVGGGVATGASNGSYFATANYGAYEQYFNNTEISSVLTNLKEKVTYARQYQPASGTFDELTLDDTKAYLKNPAKLVYKTTDTKLDGAFASLFTSTGTTRNGEDVFGKMKESGPDVFGTADNVGEWLRASFTKDEVAKFIESEKNGLSASQKQTLSVLAETIYGREDGVKAYLDGAGNINVSGWNKIVADGGLAYLKYRYKGPLSVLKGESLYDFITAFYKDYEFVLTQDVSTQISQIYGVSDSSWFSGNTPNYDAFINTFGFSSVDFAGSLSGNGALIKTGYETLTLSGQNSYTGITKVEAGELRVDWNAIQRSSGIIVEQGALLTINAADEDIRDSYKNPETGSDTGYERNKGYGFLSSGSRADDVRLFGAGTVLKLGTGKVDLGRALLDGNNGSDFTGSFLVTNGSLKATLDAVACNKAGTQPAFNVYFSKETANAAPAFELALDRSSGYDYIVGTQPTELGFGGEIKGEGTFILDAGVTRPSLDVASVNNILAVSAGKFAVDTVKVKTGTLKISVCSGVSHAVFNSAKLDQNAGLTFDLADTYALADAKIDGSGGKLTVATSLNADGKSYADHTLTLTNNNVLTGVSSLALVGGAKLELAGTAGNLELTSLTADTLTCLKIDAGRTVELNGSGTLAGILTGEGRFIYKGEKDSVLKLGNDTKTASGDAFGGEIEFNGGTIEFASADGSVVSYKGLSLKETLTANAERTLVKSGAGTVKILRESAGTNSVSVSNLKMDIQAGTLAVSGDMFSENGGKLPTSINIAGGATFSFCDEFASSSFDLGTLNALTGTGTLKFDLSKDTEIEVSAFNAQEFNGTVDISEKTTLNLGANVTEFSAFSGEGTVNVAASNLTVRVNGNSDGTNIFTGNVEGNLTSLTVVGDGALVFGDKNKIPVDTIRVGNDLENGGVGVVADWTGTVNAEGNTSSVLIVGDKNFEGIVSVGANVENLNLSTQGVIALGEKAVAKAFGLDKSGFSLDGNVNVTLANIANETLVLKNLDKLADEAFTLKTNAGTSGESGIVFDGTRNAASTRAAAPRSATQVEWAKDITGTGDVWFKNGADVKLSAGTLSYTGATTVDGTSTLEYASGTVSQSSSLTVKKGATLVGGVDLVVAGSNVVFEGGSNFKFTGDAIRFTGTAEVMTVSSSSKINVTLDEDALNSRGVPVALFELIGTDGKNKITWDNLNIADVNTLGYYKDTTNSNPNRLAIYVTADDLANVPGVDLHEGLSVDFISYLSGIATPVSGSLKAGLTDKEAQLAEAIIKTPNSSLAGTLNNLSPLSYGAMLALPQSGFVSDIAAISSRIEQRRYDSYTQFAWEIHDDWEFFAQAQGSLAQADEGKPDTRTFDMNSYGAIAGMDVKMNATTVAGFSFAYDFGDADIHDNGGEIQSHDVRATAFIGKLIENRFYVDAGVQAGFAMFDVDRRTVLGGVNGDTTAWHAGAFANAGMLIPLGMSEDEKTSVNLMPYVGLAYSYYGVNAFDESGSATALDTDSFGASSLRATVGASLAVTFPWLGKTSRFNLDVAYTRELMDSEADIDYAMPEISEDTYTASAKAFSEDTFSIGPRLSYDLDRNNSIYGGYRFEMSTDSDTAHSVNLGFRSRF